MKKFNFILEIIWGFLIIDALNYFLFPTDPGFKNLFLHPYWVVILFISSRRGFIAGILTGLVASSHYVIFFLNNIPTRMKLEQIAETNDLVLPFAFVLVGLILGNIRQRYITEEKRKEALLSTQEKELKKLKEMSEYSEKSRRILEAKIVGQTTTVKTLSEAARKLETLEYEDVYNGSLEILAKHFQVKKACLYMLDGDYYVLKSAYGWNPGSLVEGKIQRGKSLMDFAFKENRIMTVKDLLNKPEVQNYTSELGAILVMLPIRDEKGNPIGVVNIEKMEFLSFNKSNLEIIALLLDWVSQAIHKITFLKSINARLIDDEDYHIYHYRHFKNVLENEFEKAKKFGLNLTVSMVKIERFGFLKERSQELISKTVVSLLKKYLSSTDMIFKYRFDGSFAVISPCVEDKILTESFQNVKKTLQEISMDKLSTVSQLSLLISSQQFRQNMLDPSELMTPALKDCKLLSL